ncbi:hypothetical protein EMIT0373P_10509 [Pseudomonas chlororaphis]
MEANCLQLAAGRYLKERRAVCRIILNFNEAPSRIWQKNLNDHLNPRMRPGSPVGPRA